MEWKKLRRKIQVPAYIQFFISIVFWIAAGLRLYGTLPLRCVQLRKHSKAREKRYSFGYAVSFIFACYQILWTFPKSRYLCSRYLPLVCG